MRPLSEKLLSELIRRLAEAPCPILDLSSDLGVSKPSLSRCVRILRERGYPIRTIRGRSGWEYALMEGEDPDS